MLLNILMTCESIWDWKLKCPQTIYKLLSMYFWISLLCLLWSTGGFENSDDLLYSGTSYYCCVQAMDLYFKHSISIFMNFDWKYFPQNKELEKQAILWIKSKLGELCVFNWGRRVYTKKKKLSFPLSFRKNDEGF